MKNDFIYFLSWIGFMVVLVFAISGFAHLVNDENKACQVTFRHGDRVNVTIGVWE
jgi:hypothetical protein